MNPAYLTKSFPTRSTPSLVSLLERNEAFAQLRTGVEQIAALERDLAAALPDYLAPNVSPGPIKNGLLTLLTAHNALAARLRHLEPGLLQALQQRGWLVHAIKIRVQLQHAKPTSVAKKSPSIKGWLYLPTSLTPKNCPFTTANCRGANDRASSQKFSRTNIKN